MKTHNHTQKRNNKCANEIVHSHRMMKNKCRSREGQHNENHSNQFVLCCLFFRLSCVCRFWRFGSDYLNGVAFYYNNKCCCFSILSSLSHSPCRSFVFFSLYISAFRSRTHSLVRTHSPVHVFRSTHLIHVTFRHPHHVEIRIHLTHIDESAAQSNQHTHKDVTPFHTRSNK